MNDIATAQEHLEEAYQLETQNKLQEALEACDLAIQLNPELAEAYNNRGIILEQLGDLDGAIDAYEIAVELQPSSEVALENLLAAQNEAAFQKRKRILGIFLLGALGYGLSLMFVRILDAVFNGYVLEVSPEGYEVYQLRLGVMPSILLRTVLFSVGMGMGTGILAKVIGATKKKLLVISSIVGFGLLYLIISITVQAANFLGFGTFLDPGLNLFTSIIYFALPGALVGLLFARVNGNSKHAIIAALAGSSLGVIGILNNTLSLQVMGIAEKILPAYRIYRDPQLYRFFVLTLPFGLQGFIGGCIFGIALALTLLMINSERQTDEG